MTETAKARSGWKTWRFDQIAINVNERIDNPAEADVEYYVGLEHLDTDSLKIRRWGKPDEVEATKLRFKKGDIIFGRRRAYQRKLAVADFDGICSAHAMVLRPRPEVVLPEFLPFFLQSDVFMNRALKISVGSLSPTINWKTLAAQKFIVPTLRKQKEIAEVLLSLDETKETYLYVEEGSRTLFKSKLAEIWDSLPKIKIRELIEKGYLSPPQDGNHGEKHPKASDYVQEGIPFVMAADLENGRVNLLNCKFISKQLADTLRIGFSQEGDVLLSHKGTVGAVARVPKLKTASFR